MGKGASESASAHNRDTRLACHAKRKHSKNIYFLCVVAPLVMQEAERAASSPTNHNLQDSFVRQGSKLAVFIAIVGDRWNSSTFILLGMPKANKSKVRVLSSRTVFRGKVFSVNSDEVVEPSNIRARRDILHHPGSVVVLAIDESRKQPRVLLEYQFRYAANQFLWELPAGRVDEGEDELAAAKRELLEETGYTAKRWELALKYFASPGFMDETMAIYLARELQKGRAQPESDEFIRQRLFPVSDVVHRIMKRKIHDGKTVAGVLWFQQKYTELKPA